MVAIGSETPFLFWKSITLKVPIIPLATTWGACLRMNSTQKKAEPRGGETSFEHLDPAKPEAKIILDF